MKYKKKNKHPLTNSGQHMTLLATIARAMRKHHITVAGQRSRQLQILGCFAGILQCLQLVQSSVGADVTAVHFIDGLWTVQKQNQTNQPHIIISRQGKLLCCSN